MKKILMMLLALPLMWIATSCHDDDDLPDVILNVTYENAINYENALYVVKGDSLIVDNVTAEPASPNGKACQILAVQFRFNGWLVATDPIAPFGVAIPTDGFDVGDYVLGLECPVVQVDKTPATAFITRKVRIVASEADLPVATTPEARHAGGTYADTADLTPR